MFLGRGEEKGLMVKDPLYIMGEMEKNASMATLVSECL